MASKKKHSEGIALLSVYSDEDDEEMEDAEEEEEAERTKEEANFMDEEKKRGQEDSGTPKVVIDGGASSAQATPRSLDNDEPDWSSPMNFESERALDDTSGESNDTLLDQFLPPRPKDKCSEDLQRKIDKFLSLKKMGKSFNNEVRNRKEYRNPDFLLHAVSYQDIDQTGSCFSKDVFDPNGYDPSDFCDAIELDMKHESADLARSRVASKRFNSLWREVQTVNLLCTLSRYSKSRSTSVTPFKTVFRNLIEDSRAVRSVSVGVDKALSGMSFDDLIEDDSDELYLTDIEFVRVWLPRVRDELEMLSISDFWIQSCWRRSDVLALVSSNCSKLVKLEVKNAWLSVVGLTQMPNLRHLTLEFIRLDDENLEKVNDCFPFLQVLNLIGVGGLKEPKIHFLHLKSCHWTVSNAPLSLAIVAPNLLELRLKCNKPKSLVLDTPKLVKFYLSVEDAEGVSFSELGELDTLEVVSPDVYRLFRNTRFGNKIRKLAVDSVKTMEHSERLSLGLGTLLEAFPSIASLTLSHVTWSNIKTHFQSEGVVHMKGTDTALKRITARVQTSDYTDVSFIRSILNSCRGLTDMRLMIHQDTDPRVRDLLISACTMSNPRVRWSWGTWAEGGEDIWVSNGT